MESSCLNYSLKKPSILISSQRDKLLQRSAFSFPLQKKNCAKINYFHLNGDYGASNGNSYVFPKCQAQTISNTFCAHPEFGNEGIGIVRFLQGKNFLITGATGFLAKGEALLLWFIFLMWKSYYIHLEMVFIYISVSILIFPCFISLVLIEKILRTNSDVGKFYIIIKAKDDEAAKERLINEVWTFYHLQNMV